MKAIAVTTALYLVLSISSSAAAAALDVGRQTLCRGEQKYAKFHVYVHDVYGTQNATVWKVAQGEWTNESETAFGEIRVLDNVITLGKDPDSRAVGRMQGVVAFSDFGERALTMTISLYFTAGRFNGSSLTCVGRNPVSRQNRDVPIIGGTGQFLNARGFTVSNTVSSTPDQTYILLEYYIYVVYEELATDCLERLGRDDEPLTALF